MMQYLLIVKGVWILVQGYNVRPSFLDIGDVVNASRGLCSGPITKSTAKVSLPLVLQNKLDGMLEMLKHMH